MQVFSAGGGWHFAVINDRGHVKVCPRVPSLAEGARRARAWVEDEVTRRGLSGSLQV